MHVMSNLEYSFAISELSELIGKHFSRIRKLREDTYRMKIGNTEIICELGVRLHKTNYIEEKDTDDKFVQKVAKELDNAKLLSIEQVNNDRIIAFNFHNGRLIFEMFGNGNAILVRDGITVCSSKTESWSDRDTRAGVEYKTPANTGSENLAMLAKKPELTDRYAIVVLMKLPFGKQYALEALTRLNIDEKKPLNMLNEQEIEAIDAELAKIRDHAKPRVFYQSEKPIEFSLANLSQFDGFEKKEFDTLGMAADEYYQNMDQADPELEKLVKRLRVQEQHLQSLIDEEKTSREKAEIIYNNYAFVEERIMLARTGKLAGIDKKEKSFEIEI
ncbi:NFACT family protein [Candidatus Micrarchaeota archaeon]|nr:NFACT family protein [Candidatus Micrarchaeota archaeon]